jgi:hypothetical protein
MRTPASRWSTALAVAALVFVCLSPGSAPASAAHTRLLHISARAPYFHGRLVTTDVCNSGRNVRVFRVRPSGDVELGNALTDSTGHWNVPLSPPPGHYYAKAHRYFNTSEAVRCKRTKSRTVTIH